MYFIHITFVSFISDYLLLKALTVITENMEIPPCLFAN